MQSVMRHLWYLTPDTVVFALFDQETSGAERRELARAIARTPRPQQIPLGKPQMPVQMNANPQLASFVGPESWKLWDLLGVRSDWLRLPVHRWAHNNDYIVAKEFVQGLSVVNDAAERCVRSITDYAQATRDSVYREKILLIGNSHREVFQDLRKAALARLNP